ncbi:MAG: hypothetical protein Q9190_005535 [Brigantiaea leucoxantha]
MLETSGLADPGNLAPLFWVDSALGSTIYLDGIVTLVDAKNILLTLDTFLPPEGGKDSSTYQTPHFTTAHLQISHADAILINKSDTVTPSHLSALENRIRSINGLAKIHVTKYSQPPALSGALLDLHAYDGVSSLENNDIFNNKGHSHLDPSISTASLYPLPVFTEAKLEKLQAWLQSLLWESRLEFPSDGVAEVKTEAKVELEVYRTKGRIFIEGGSERRRARMMMIQGVREVFEIVDVDVDSNEENKEGRVGGREEDDGGKAEEDEKGKIVLIGRGLTGLPLKQSLDWYLGLG